MKRSILRIFVIGLLTFGAFYLPSSAIVEVSAQADDLTVVNKTGFEIHALYMTLANAKEWGADILGVDTLARTDSVTIVFTKKEKAKLWDLRVEDADGAFIEWANLNLRDVSSVTLYYKNGKSTAVFNEEQQSAVDIRGTWLGYYEDGTISPYVWNIDLTASSTILIQDADGGKAKSKGSFNGRKITAQDFATKNGTVSADGNRISWTDGVVWVRSNDLIDLTGTWIGYYDDGTKSEYVWSIIQRGTSISIQDTKNARTKSRGTFKGSKVVAQDFATQNGRLSADGMQIIWSDGVVWKKE